MSFDFQKEIDSIQENLQGVKHRIVVMSGKGGVGKSSVSANLATYLALQGKKVGLLDVDIHGPSIPRMMGIEEGQLAANEAERLRPVSVSENLKVVSIGFLLPSQDDAVIWRGPMKISLIKQFLKDVEWGELDYLVVDCPPGTGDEPMTVAQFLGAGTDAVVVSSPQNVSILDVRKSLSFCNRIGLNILGVVINMSHFVCPDCDKRYEIFPHGDVDKMFSDFNVEKLGEIPIDPCVGRSCDEGKSLVYFYSKTPAGKAFEEFGRKVMEKIGD